MPPTLLVPLDGLPLAEAALSPASLLAEVMGAKLDLLQVVAEDDRGDAERRAHAYLAAMAATLRTERLSVSTLVMRGHPGECIARKAAAEHVAMVVMSTHCRSGLRRAMLGSVAEYVVATSPAPILVIRAGCQPRFQLNTLLLAIDGSGAAPLALTTQLAHACGARVVLLTVVPFGDLYLWQHCRGPVLDEPQAVVEARQHLTDLAERMRADGVTTEARVQIGSLAPTIVSVAAAVHADLIVMTTHARTGAQRAVLGSVADKVVRTASQPVLLSRLIPPLSRDPRPIDLIHALQHLQPAGTPQPIPEPLDHIRHTHRSVPWSHLAGT